MTSWVAIAYGALDLQNWRENASDAEIVLIATKPSEPIGLAGDSAALWRRLVTAPVSPDQMSDQELALVGEFADFGLASDDLEHRARITNLTRPWLSSPFHELVYALVGSAARDHAISSVFIKGPILHSQGLREREHSGDVDIWVEPTKVEALISALKPWGWHSVPDLWSGLPVNHSVTLKPEFWGCELDVHHHFPGVGVAEAQAFNLLLARGTPLEFAGVTVTVPEVSAHTVIESLNRSRPEIGVPRDSTQLDEAARLLAIGGTKSLDFALQAEADAALNIPLQRAFPGSFQGTSSRPPLNWRWRAEKSPVRAYFVALKAVPFRARMRVLYRLAWPKSDVALASNALAGAQTAHPVLARVQRIMRAIRREI